MLVKAKTSFAGLVTMFGGEERDIKDEQVVKDLLACGYIDLLEEDKSNTNDHDTNDSEHTDDGSLRDIKDEQVVKDLLACGYIDLLEEDKSNTNDHDTNDSEHTDDGSLDDPPESESGESDIPKQKETKDENKRTAK